MTHGQSLLVATLRLLAAACGSIGGVPDVPHPEGGGHASSGGFGLGGDDSGETTGLSSSGGTINVNNSINSINSGVDAAAYSWMASCVGRCASGQVCCGNLIPSTSILPAIETWNCQAGPCPSLPGIGPIEACSSAAECFTPGDTCGPPHGELTLPILTCNAPSSDGGSSSSSSSGGGDGGNAEGGSSSSGSM